ncbi:MAG: hypothetical protein ED559_09995 [Phycisphaera sp.]|nr:MAG: hypothetical protein ED559_09995 [Phycisphaera sp.]
MIGLGFGLLVLVAIICVMGFVLAFVHNLFEQEELPIGRGILIIFLTFVANIIITLGLGGSEMDPGMASIIVTVANFLVLAGLIKLLAYTSFGKALLMALVFSVIMFLVGLVLGNLFTTPAAS